MSSKLDFKKKFKELYLPPQRPVYVNVPSMKYIMVEGKGAPGSSDYQSSIEILYALSYTIKMSRMKGMQPEGYVEYVVPPLEGVWSGYGDDLEKGLLDKSSFQWVSMIRQPDFVTEDVFQWALGECAEKKKNLPLERAAFGEINEGTSVQMMHIGSYDEEVGSFRQMMDFVREKGMSVRPESKGSHREIYLSDPRKVSSDKLKTVLRIRVEPGPDSP